MTKQPSEIQQKQIEQALTSLGAKVAQATELCQKTQELAQASERLLIAIQRELEELYISLGQEE